MFKVRTEAEWASTLPSHTSTLKWYLVSPVATELGVGATPFPSAPNPGRGIMSSGLQILLDDFPCRKKDGASAGIT